MSDGEPLPLDVNVLTDGFRIALSSAVDRASTRLEALGQNEGDVQKAETHKFAAGSMMD
jgi:hypothetical protein